MTGEEWRECRSCGKRLLDYGALGRPGRNRQFCDSACRQAGYRARRADPEGWRRDQAARDRRARARDRRAAAAERQHDESMARFQEGVDRMMALSAEEFQVLLNEVTGGPVPDGEKLLSDSKIRRLLLLALVSDFDGEAVNALTAARRLHRKAVTDGT